MLLPKKPKSIEDLPGAIARGVHASVQLRILTLQLIEALHETRGRTRCVELSQPTLGLQRTLAEARQLVGEMADERAQLAKGFLFRPSVV